MPELQTLEAALSDVDRRVDQAIKSTKKLAAALGAASKSSAHGDLAALRRALKDAGDALQVAQLDVKSATSSWTYDEDSEQAYFRDGGFTSELKAAAASQGLRLEEDDGQLMCYPVTLRVDAPRRLALIDRKPYKFTRPSILAAHLKDVQRRPPRFKAVAFIESVYLAWNYARHLEARGHDLPRGVRVDKVYAALTLAPGAAKDYTKQEFGRDLYLLESSDVEKTKKGSRIRFSRATGTKSGAGVISVVGEDGRPVLYSSIEFDEAAPR